MRIGIPFFIARISGAKLYTLSYLSYFFYIIMLSLYIHIPFCASKCAYCSFNSIPTNSSDTLIDEYIQALKQEIDYYTTTLVDKELKTLYFGWGTPSRIWVERIIDIIEYISERFDIENLAELSIELNPYPAQEVLDFVRIVNKKYPKISRLRYSFGIQSFDDEILKMTGRAYSFGSIVEFLRSLVQLKQDNNVLNFDFIAFGKFQVSKNGYKQLWHEFKRDFFQKFLASWYVDSISLYTLEGLKDKKDGVDHHSKEFDKKTSYTKWGDFSTTLEMTSTSSSTWHGNDEEIMEEFTLLKTMITDAWFGRYEISNFAQAGKASIHNMVYRNMENYLWLGLSASSFMLYHSEAEPKNISNHVYPSIPSGWQALRRTNTWNIKQYIQWHWIDEKEVQILNESDLLIEEFFLRLRTREGIADISKFTSVLVPHYQWLLANYQSAWLVDFDWLKLQLTDLWMNVYNTIITDLLQKI